MFAELFNIFARDVLPESFDHWDNQCHDGEVESESYEACQKVCEDDTSCFQFTHHDGHCALGHSIHLGMPKKSENAVTWRSGWLRDRIKNWVDNQAPCKPEFPWT